MTSVTQEATDDMVQLGWLLNSANTLCAYGMRSTYGIKFSGWLIPGYRRKNHTHTHEAIPQANARRQSLLGKERVARTSTALRSLMPWHSNVMTSQVTGDMVTEASLPSCPLLPPGRFSLDIRLRIGLPLDPDEDPEPEPASVAA